MKTVALLMASVVLTLPVFAHGGGLNAQGCHNNNKTGGYHCHRPASPAPAARPSNNQSSSQLRQSLKQPADGTIAGAYRNCAAARAAGAAPVRRGEAGYGRHLDRDNDGVGCE